VNSENSDIKSRNAFCICNKISKTGNKKRGKQEIKRQKKRRKEEEIQSKRQQRVAIGDLGPLLDIRTVAN